MKINGYHKGTLLDVIVSSSKRIIEADRGITSEQDANNKIGIAFWQVELYLVKRRLQVARMAIISEEIDPDIDEE